MADKPNITYARLREVLRYDPDTGEFCWAKTLSSRRLIGQKAGCLDKSTGYIRIRVDDKLYHAHRLAFKYMTGRWPVPQCDHIDLNKSNNKWVNLREATASQNLHNIKTFCTNTTGFKGVHKRYGKFAARIDIGTRTVSLGIFETAEEAHQAYCAAAKSHFGDYARTA